MEPTVQPVKYQVSCLPDSMNGIDYEAFALDVEYTGLGRWAVRKHSRCLDVDGRWDYEPRPLEREDDWLDTHRFDLDTALELAKRAAPHVKVNGWTVERVLAEEAAAKDPAEGED